MRDDQGDRAPVAIRGVLFDLLMAVMNSLDVWRAAAGDQRRGLAWRDATTARMAAADGYAPYEGLVAASALDVGMESSAVVALLERWSDMQAWPDARAIASLAVQYAFVTNCSARLARLAAERSGLDPRFVLSAEEAGRFKPHPAIYLAACDRLSVAPPGVVFVAGAAYDATGADAAGLRTFLVQRTSVPDALNPAIRVVRTLGDVVDAIGDGSVEEQPWPPP